MSDEQNGQADGQDVQDDGHGACACGHCGKVRALCDVIDDAIVAAGADETDSVDALVRCLCARAAMARKELEIISFVAHRMADVHQRRVIVDAAGVMPIADGDMSEMTGEQAMAVVQQMAQANGSNVIEIQANADIKARLLELIRPQLIAQAMGGDIPKDQQN